MDLGALPELLQAVAWPLVTMGLVVFFRRDMSKLFSRLRRIVLPGGADVKFGKRTSYRPKAPTDGDNLADWLNGKMGEVTDRLAAQLRGPDEAQTAQQPFQTDLKAALGSVRGEVLDAYVNHRLGRQIERLIFNETDLKEVLAFLSAYADLDIHPDWRALYEIGLTPTTKVNLEARRVSVGEVLTRVAEDLNAFTPRSLGALHIVERGHVRFTTGAALQRRQE